MLNLSFDLQSFAIDSPSWTPETLEFSDLQSDYLVENVQTYSCFFHETETKIMFFAFF